MDNKLFTQGKERVKGLEGTLQKVSEATVAKLDAKEFLICQLLEKGETERVVKLVKNFNGHLEESRKLRSQFLCNVRGVEKRY